MVTKEALTGIEVAKHNTAKDCWVIVHVCDITPLLNNATMT